MYARDKFYFFSIIKIDFNYKLIINYNKKTGKSIVNIVNNFEFK